MVVVFDVGNDAKIGIWVDSRIVTISGRSSGWVIFAFNIAIIEVYEILT